MHISNTYPEISLPKFLLNVVLDGIWWLACIHLTKDSKFYYLLSRNEYSKRWLVG